MTAAPRYEACVAQMTATAVSGWVVDKADPCRPLGVELLIDGQVVGTARADEPRDSLLQAGFASSEHGFRVRLPAPGDAGHAIEVRVAGDGHMLPWTVSPAFKTPSGNPVRRPPMTEAELTVALNPGMVAAALASPPYRGLNTTFEEDPLGTLLHHAATLP